MKTVYLGEGLGLKKELQNHTIALYKGKSHIKKQNELIVNYIEINDIQNIYVCLAYPNHELEELLEKKYTYVLINRKKFFLLSDDILNNPVHDFIFTNIYISQYSLNSHSFNAWNSAINAMELNPYMGFNPEYLNAARALFDMINNSFGNVDRISLCNENNEFEIEFYCDNEELLETIIGMAKVTLGFPLDYECVNMIAIIRFNISHLGVFRGNIWESVEYCEN